MSVKHLKNIEQYHCSVPKPGVYGGIPDVTYHSWQGASSSRLKLLSKSAAHLKHQLDNPSAQTDAMKLGTALHTKVLQPSLYSDDLLPGKMAKTIEKNKGKVDEMASSIVNHESAKKLLKECEEKELSIVWNDEATGVQCKGRADALSSKLKTIVDIKTTKDASLREFQRSIGVYGYHMQAAHYIRGLRANGFDIDHYVIIALEKEPPYACAVYRIEESAVTIGAHELDHRLKYFKKCLDDDCWPGYGSSVEDIELPDWYKVGGEHE